MSKYLEFHKSGWTGKTDIYEILSKKSGDILGRIKWYGPWRQYCFFPTAQTVFNNGCMKDIIDFIDNLMRQK